jgi:hypothetical protein
MYLVLPRTLFVNMSGIILHAGLINIRNKAVVDVNDWWNVPLKGFLLVVCIKAGSLLRLWVYKKIRPIGCVMNVPKKVTGMSTTFLFLTVFMFLELVVFTLLLPCSFFLHLCNFFYFLRLLLLTYVEI